MGTTDNRQRYYFIDNLRWVTVVLVLIYHVFYNFNALGKNSNGDEKLCLI